MYNRYPEEIIEEIRINNDIVDVVSEYLKLDKKGKDYFGLCPFHKEKTPSFSVVPAKQIFYCFGCGKGGNVFHFIMNIENLDYIESVRLLAERARIELPENDSEEESEKLKFKQEIININTRAARFFFDNLMSQKGEPGRKYLANRDINEKTVKRFGLGYAPEQWDLLYKYLVEQGFSEKAISASGLVLTNKTGRSYDRFRSRVMFPIFDLRGNIIGFGGRVLDSSTPKYMNSPETVVYNKGKSLYALNFAKNSGTKKIIIVEGYMDVISLHQSGIINTVASLGTALTESQGRILKKYAEEIVIGYDADSAGQSAAMRGLDLLSDMGCNVKVLMIPQGKDPDEFIRKNGDEVFRKLVENALSLVEYKIKGLKKQINTDNTEGKITFLNKTADILSKIDNNVEREMYARKIADDYGITQEALFAEVYRRIKPRAGSAKILNGPGNTAIRRGKEVLSGTDTRILHDERLVLALLCVDNSIYKRVKDRLSLDMFVDPDNRQLAGIVFEKLESRKGIVPGELLNMLNNEKTEEFARIFNEECHCDDNFKAIVGKIRNIEMNRAQRRQKEVLELLKDPGSLSEGDVERLKLEFKSLTLLIKEQKSV